MCIRDSYCPAWDVVYQQEMGKEKTGHPVSSWLVLFLYYDKWKVSLYEVANLYYSPHIYFCLLYTSERGVRTFESYTRNTLDLQAVPVIKELTHLPIIVDPSHAGGKWWLVNPMAKAAVAAGCDGLMIEVHNNPEKALCDGPQSLKPAKFEQLMKELKPIADAVGKEI